MRRLEKGNGGKVVIFNKCRRNLKKCLNMALVMLDYSYVGDFVNSFIWQ
jgi:hypothetical protein